ncbi:MAG: YbaB/EbfC family nucleoid-associated protein [Alphaproteobacteria bacterium]
MKNLGQLMKQAQEMQDKMAEMQDSLVSIEIEGVAGAGLVKLTLNGKGEMRRLYIDPTLANPDEAEILEDLIVAAHNDAKGKIEARVQEETQKLMGGMSLPPGMKFPF